MAPYKRCVDADRLHKGIPSTLEGLFRARLLNAAAVRRAHVESKRSLQRVKDAKRKTVDERMYGLVARGAGRAGCTVDQTAENALARLHFIAHDAHAPQIRQRTYDGFGELCAGNESVNEKKIYARFISAAGPELALLEIRTVRKKFPDCFCAKRLRIGRFGCRMIGDVPLFFISFIIHIG